MLDSETIKLHVYENGKLELNDGCHKYVVKATYKDSVVGYKEFDSLKEAQIWFDNWTR